jgi:hypothetical protein
MSTQTKFHLFAGAAIGSFLGWSTLPAAPATEAPAARWLLLDDATVEDTRTGLE